MSGFSKESSGLIHQAHIFVIEFGIEKGCNRR
jgi:hypothetical protein